MAQRPRIAVVSGWKNTLDCVFSATGDSAKALLGVLGSTEPFDFGLQNRGLDENLVISAMLYAQIFARSQHTLRIIITEHVQGEYDTKQHRQNGTRPWWRPDDYLITRGC